MNTWLDQNRVHLSLALLLLLVAGLALWQSRRPDPAPLTIAVPTVQPTPFSSEIKVYVSGGVAAPGVYPVSRDARVEDAVRAAGGASLEADLTRINLAARLQDEQHVHVPNAQEPAPPMTFANPTGAPAGRLDLNTASAKDLEALPGIGTVTAGKIIAYRQDKGLFRSVEQLLSEKLVTSSVYGRIKDLLTVR